MTNSKHEKDILAGENQMNLKCQNTTTEAFETFYSLVDSLRKKEPQTAL